MRKRKADKNEYQIRCVANVIKGKEKRREDATFERKLLSSWSEYEGFEGAKQVLAGLGKPPH